MTSKTKLALGFFVKFFIISAVIYFVWLQFFAPLYNRFLCRVMNVVLDFFQQHLVTFAKKNIIIVSVKGLEKDPALWKKIYGNIIHTNIVPLLSLFLATPGLRVIKRIYYITISLLILFFTHIFHLYLDIFVLFPHTVHISDISILYNIKLFGFKVMAGLFVLWEQILRMILPFLLWAAFTFRHVISLFRERVSCE